MTHQNYVTLTLWIGFRTKLVALILDDAASVKLIIALTVLTRHSITWNNYKHSETSVHLTFEFEQKRISFDIIKAEK